MSGGLLDGLRVVDASLWQPGHYATQLLADLGADVVKIEPPGGDRMRPMAEKFELFNGRKRTRVLDLKSEAGRAELLALVHESEVFVENYRPGVADRLGVGFEALRAVNPAIVYCSISGFGQTGPLAGTTGHDPNYQAYAGAMTAREGGPPMPSGVLVGDQGAGMAAAFAILAGVVCARRTGEGEHIDVSMTDVVASWVAAGGTLDRRRSAAERTLGPSPAMGVFAALDGHVVLGVHTEDHLWDALCTALGLPQHVGLTVAQRSAAAAQLRRELEEVVATWKRDALVEELGRHGAPVAPVLDREEMLDHPHFRERGLFPEGPGGFRSLAHPIRYRIHPALPPGPAPSLDGGLPEPDAP